jgi:O-antigen/teichoic acid export membrane protein
MSKLNRIWETWKQDKVLGNVVRNSGYLFSSNTISMGLSAVQGILSALLLGPLYYGWLGIIVKYASSVNRLLSFRMTEVVIKNAGQEIDLGRRDQAAAIIKLAGITEAFTSLIAYGVLALLAPLAVKYIIRGDATVIPWVLIYGLSVISSIVFETSTAILQLGNHYRSQAVLNLAQSILTAGWITVAFIFKGGVYSVLMGYLAGKLLLGLGTVILALYWIKPLLGEGWWKAPLRLITHKRKLAGFAISTNLSGTLNTVVRDSEELWLALLVSPITAGYYKFALAILNIIIMPISPFINTTFPQISSSVAKREWERLKNLLKRTSSITAIWSGICFIGLVTAGPWFFQWFKQGAFAPAFPVVLILFFGVTVPNILFWNRPLVLSFGDATYPLVVTSIIGAVKTGLMFLLVPTLGVLAQAGVLSGYGLISASIIAWNGWGRVKRAELATGSTTAT